MIKYTIKVNEILTLAGLVVGPTDLMNINKCILGLHWLGHVLFGGRESQRRERSKLLSSIDLTNWRKYTRIELPRIRCKVPFVCKTNFP